VTRHFSLTPPNGLFFVPACGYHEPMVAILFDKTGERHGRGNELRIMVSGRQIAGKDSLRRVTAALP
jgi:hypothetical protein